MRGGSAMQEAKSPKCGKLQNQTPVPGIALLKPARHGPCKIKDSDQAAIKTAFSEGSTISTAYILNIFITMFSTFKKSVALKEAHSFIF